MSRLKRLIWRVFPRRAMGRPVAFVAAHLARLSSRRVGLAFVYHAVDHSTGDPKRQLVAPHGTGLFNAQVRHLKRAYRVVPASELVRAVAERRRGQRLPVAITFDDDLASHRALALPILSRAGVVATFFLCGGSLRAPFAYWWERLQVAYDRGVELRTLVPAAIEKEGIWPVAMAIEGLEPESRDRVAGDLAATLGPDPGDAGMRAEDIRALVAAGCEVGFHTLRHDRLPPLDDERLAHALTAGRAELESVVGRRLTTMAYPHGYADERVAAAARNAGFETAYTTRSEPVTSTTNPLLAGRMEPSFVSAGHFAVDVIRALLRRAENTAR